MSSHLRPDEIVSQSEIRKAENRNNQAGSILKTGLAVGAGAIGSKFASKIMPFLSEHIPEDLAYKGINKVMPGLGDFLKKGMKQGLSLKSGIDYLKNEIANESTKQPAKDKRNIIEQYSPGLHKFISDHLKAGKTTDEAGALAQLDDKYKNAINKIEKDHKTRFSSIMHSIYGGGQMAQQPKQGPPQAQQTPMQPQQQYYDIQRGPEQNQQMQPQANMQQPGQGQQMLAQTMQKIAQSLGLNL